MAFFNSAIDILGTLVVALGGGVCAWGGINLLEGYGNDNPGAKSQGVKQLMNIRKNIDYTDMYAALDSAMERNLSQVELYYEIGRAICQRT